MEIYRVSFLALSTTKITIFRQDFRDVLKFWHIVFFPDDFKYVTCGSVVKLLNNQHNVRLHSHEVKYGSGSGQQVSLFIYKCFYACLFNSTKRNFNSLFFNSQCIQVFKFTMFSILIIYVFFFFLQTFWKYLNSRNLDIVMIAQLRIEI